MTETMYAYRVTEVTGSQVGKLDVGEFLLEREFKGNGSYTWHVVNFKTGKTSASITGRYVGKVTGEDGHLDRESKDKLSALDGKERS